jgi:deoxyribodipyrimidine photo-lyase
MDGRITQLNNKPVKPNGACVLYWMQKDQRADDNWALIRAAEIANNLKVPLLVGFILTTQHKTPNLRQYDFMLKGLAEVARDLRAHGIGFIMRSGNVVDEISSLSSEVSAAVVVTDQSQLNLGRNRRVRVAEKLEVLLEEVCSNLIVPPHIVIDKPAFSAYQMRRRLEPVLDKYLVEYPTIRIEQEWKEILSGLDDQDPDQLIANIEIDYTVGLAELIPGPAAARRRLDDFIARGLQHYGKDRNNPNKDGTSSLSPYLHFGQISSQRIALDINAHAAQGLEESIRSYLDELITWREVAANYSTFNQYYSSYNGAPEWAKKSLDSHRDDPREYVYSIEEFSLGNTHDPLWNAAQLQMVKTGRMHGYMRMYWAKKILEWTASPEEAILTAIHLNDKYELDGRDPGGYAGIMWSIAGLHDRPWFDRPIYGQIRYMNDNGARSKFDVEDLT